MGDWVLRVTFMLMVIALFIGLWTVRNALMLIFLAVIVALALHVPVHRFERLGMGRGLAVLTTLILVALVGGLMGVLLVSTFVEQTDQLIDQLPDAFDQARSEYDRLADPRSMLGPRP